MKIIKNIIVFFIGVILLIQISGCLRPSIAEKLGVVTWHVVSLIGSVMIMVIVDTVLDAIFSRVSKRK